MSVKAMKGALKALGQAMFPRKELIHREWFGLTDKELEELSNAKLGSYDLCLEVESKLKEKNHEQNHLPQRNG